MRTRNLGLVCLACVVWSIPRLVRGDASATSSLTFSGLTIAPSAGTVVYGSNWTAEAFAQAQNSLGELAQQYTTGTDSTVSADGTVTFASGHGDASPITISATASGNASIPGIDSQQAITAGQPDVFNTITITGGIGSVDVVFSLDLSGFLSVMTDTNGLSAQAESIFNLTLDGNSLLFSDHLLSIGTNDSQTLPISEHLSTTMSLQYDTEYFLFAQPDAETMVINVPEPSAFGLVLAGLCTLIAGAMKKKELQKMKKSVRSLGKCSLVLVLLFIATRTDAKYAGGGGNPPSPGVTTTIPGPSASTISLTDGNLTQDPGECIKPGTAGKPCPKRILNRLRTKPDFKKCEDTGCKECNKGCPAPPPANQTPLPGNQFPPGSQKPSPTDNSCSSYGNCPNGKGVSPTHGVSFKMNYNSSNADGSRTQLDTGMGNGWTHTYNDFLFTQVGNMFRYDGNGQVTKFTRGGNSKYTADIGYFQTLLKNPNGTYTLTDKYGTKYNYASIPNTPFLVGGPVLRLTSIVDRNGDSNTLTYTAGKLTSVSDAYGRSLTFTYNPSNRLIRVIDPLSRTNTFVYDSTGRQLTKMIDAQGCTNQYGYNFQYQITQHTDRDGRLTRNIYAGGKPTMMMDSTFHKWFGLNNSTGWAMNTNALSQNQLRLYIPSTTTKTDGRNNAWTYSYNSLGYITQVIAPDGATTSYTYDLTTRCLTGIIDPNGNATTYKYDARGNRTNTTDALGNVTKYTYETNFNQVTSMTDPKGRTTTYQYDTSGNRIREIDPTSHTNSWSYDTHGNTLTEVDKLGNVTSYQYDSLGNRTNMTDALGNVTSFVYDSVGNLTSVTDANGHTTQYQYDGLNRVVQETDPDSGITRYAYDSEGNRTNIVDRNSHATSYQYDSRQRRTGMTDALGEVATFTYDGNNNLLSKTDRNGNTTSYQYDLQNRLTQITDALGNTNTASYDPAGNVLSTTDPDGHTTVYTYDALNRRTSMTDANGAVTLYEYDTGGSGVCLTCGATPGSSLVTKMTDANGNVTYYKYDDLDRQIKVIRKVGSTNDVINVGVDAVTTFTYDAVGNQISLTEPNGNTTVYSYDTLNRQTNTVNAAGDSTTTLYDGVNNVVTNISPGGNHTVYLYDAMDRVTNTVDDLGLITRTTYDAVGNVISVTDGNGNTTTSSYDSLDRRTNTVDALGNVTTYRYDAEANVVTNIDREARITTYSYDALYRKTGSVDPMGHLTQFQYDPVGNLIQITDANGNSTFYQYDNVNRLTQETYADTKSRTFAYDPVGNRINRTDQNGKTTTYVYDDLYRLTQRNYSGGTNDTFGYDLSGRMTNSTRSGWVVRYAYDGANRVTNTTQNGKTFISSYDIVGRTVTNTYPGGRTIIQQYDLRNRKAEIDDGVSPPIVQYSYDSANRLLARDYRNGTTTTYAYDSLDRVTSIEDSNATARITGFGYDYTNEGQKRFEEKRHNTGDSECYGYDALDRLVDFEVGTLVGSCVTGVVTQTQYGLDAVGNWTNKTTDAVTEARTHDVVNEITLIDATTLFYDDNGNLINDGTYAYTYDEENRLTRITRIIDTALVGVYQYDALGRRVQKIANPDGSPVTTRYFYDDSRVVEEQDGLGTTVATYVYGNYVDEALTMDRAGQTYYYHHNAQWSPEAITDSTGTNVLERYTYDAYGSPIVTDGSGLNVSSNTWGTAHSVVGNPYLFTGRQLDEEAGLYFYRARYYDSIKGRFLQRDPVEYSDGMNLYQYVKDSPMNGTDPDGRKVFCGQLSVEVTVGGGFTPCVMYCEDECGNWGIYKGIGFNVGFQIGGGAQLLVMPGLTHVKQVTGQGWSVQGSYGPASATIQGSIDEKTGPTAPTGGGGGVGMGLKAGASASFTLTGELDSLYNYDRGECPKKSTEARPPCCQYYYSGMETGCFQGTPGPARYAWNCTGPFTTCRQTTGTCDGKRCR